MLFSSPLGFALSNPVLILALMLELLPNSMHRNKVKGKCKVKSKMEEKEREAQRGRKQRLPTNLSSKFKIGGSIDLNRWL